jgi:hypothetical protein
MQPSLTKASTESALYQDTNDGIAMFFVGLLILGKTMAIGVNTPRTAWKIQPRSDPTHDNYQRAVGDHHTWVGNINKRGFSHRYLAGHLLVQPMRACITPWDHYFHLVSMSRSLDLWNLGKHNSNRAPHGVKTINAIYEAQSSVNQKPN